MSPRVKTKAPKHLTAPTRQWWEAVCEQWELEDHHRRLLTLAGESWDRAVQARKAIAEQGLTYNDRFGTPRARPEISIERDSRLAFARLLRELGLDVAEPDSRPPRIGGQRH